MTLQPSQLAQIKNKILAFSQRSDKRVEKHTISLRNMHKDECGREFVAGKKAECIEYNDLFKSLFAEELIEKGDQ